MIDRFLKNFEHTKIKLIAGDLPFGTYDLDGSMLKQVATESSESVNLSESVKKINLKNEVTRDQYEPFVGAGVGALIGLRMFGILGAAGGAVAGHFMMSGKNEVSATFELKDGRSFIAVMSPDMLSAIRAISKC
ncbi:MAG: hypothetical protein K2X93_23390 [Candidatus Obscuribacterales bacterium]|nr:hypothetical protein [Candidatus Obscuribacterales bacterium]